MLRREIAEILEASKPHGWVLEPEAKRIFSLAGLDIPKFRWAKEPEEAIRFAREIGYPVVAKIVSPKVIHKSEYRGVQVGIDGDKKLVETFDRFRRIDGFSGVLVEEMISGVELIVGSKTDDQFGPVVLLGMGGTAVEIYRDVSLRMAPLSDKDVDRMIDCLKARRLLEGYRGSAPIDRVKLVSLLNTFSEMVMETEREVESIDLNPVLCSSTRCVVADARILLKKTGT